MARIDHAFVGWKREKKDLGKNMFKGSSDTYFRCPFCIYLRC